ncbi:DUF1684 domain-containing protein [Bifidobacterium subtile]|uniref:DUF1684 domain-containing protein n=1 Tax=Bifidobacterium subtile TaxID=77635 RepID=A0A087DTM4_9BIFI|nr:DUF1684 domain-containing protein [Bifidobacterium subtile]KFI98874.1 hypothetical protein BISU_2076 [Bifidobacterium subtile]QOL36429.1 DUF1684 domain-containing protein [Bifidobacterium subtile]
MWNVERITTYQQITAQSAKAFAVDWEEWHSGRKERLIAPHGWLSLRSIDWLQEGVDKSIEGFPGTFRQEGNNVIYTPEPGKNVVNKGKVITESKTISVPQVADFNVEDFDFGEIRAQLIKRISDTRAFAVRIRDPHSAAIENFAGIPHYDPDQKWVFPARYVPRATWESSVVDAVVGDLSHDETTIGTLYVTIAGLEFPLTVFQGHNDHSGLMTTDDSGNEIYLDNRTDTEDIAFVLFKDKTSGKETYGGARALTFNIHEPAQVSYVDFNRAWNLPCAFTAYCTCPFSPQENTLPIPILAGEKTPEHQY